MQEKANKRTSKNFIASCVQSKFEKVDEEYLSRQLSLNLHLMFITTVPKIAKEELRDRLSNFGVEC